MKAIRFFVLSIVVLLPGCACAQGAPDRDVQELASALTKVASAVESTVHVKHEGAGLKDAALLQKATKHDPGLLAPFRSFVMKAEHNGDHALVMVCSEDGAKAFLVDATCTRGAEPSPLELLQSDECRIDPRAVARVCP